MNPQSKLLFAFGVLVSTATCSGQRPICKKTMLRFAAEIIRVDSILSTSSYYKQSAFSNNRESCKDSIRFEFIRDKIKQKKGSICPSTVETGPPKKI